jgi:TolA-binding protein
VTISRRRNPERSAANAEVRVVQNRKRLFPGIAGWLCLVAGAFAVTSAFAQSTRDRLDQLEQQMLRIERVIANNNDSQTDLLRKLQELQAENQALRNEIEKLQFETVQAADRQRQLYMDLDQRLEALSAGGVAMGGGSSQPGAAPNTGAQSPFVTEVRPAQAGELRAGFERVHTLSQCAP